MKECDPREWATDMQKFIAIAEACHRGSYSWHVLDWLSYKNRIKYPLVRRQDCVINFNAVLT